MSQRRFSKSTLAAVAALVFVPIPVIVIVIVLTAASVLPAWASLGGDTASIQADQLHMQGSRTITAAQSYTVHEIQAATGTVVREYLSPEGKVFAVAWHGPRMPDLRQLLGAYFEPYQTAVQARSGVRMVRKPILIAQPGLVMQIGGHLRAFSGKAYVPDALPPNLRVEDIQ
jgi:Protein of unknown function (DUF2844)